MATEVIIITQRIGFNPTKDKFYANWIGSGTVSIELYNTQGQKLLSSELNNKSEAIDVANLQSGVYFLHLELDEKVVLKKLMIE